MQFDDVIRQRYSVRSYRGTPIPDDVLQRVLDAFVLAPTAANRQPIGLVVIKTEGREQELHRVYNAEWFARQPPLVVCACAVPEAAWRRRDGKHYADVDVTIAMDHLILAATNEGLGTCWIGAFDPVAAREVFGLPQGVEPIAMTPLGYPADEMPAKLRKPKEQLIHWERW
ncbi:MAG TPA: nitroreductase [Chloroflexi bacterium]|nr:nitroreductase [Chloroflexota bacterium]